MRDLLCHSSPEEKRSERSVKKESKISVHANGKAIYKGDGRFYKPKHF